MLKFILRLINKVLVFLLIALPLQLISIILLFPFCLLYDIGQMPVLIRWFDSADPYIGRNTEVIDRINQGWYIDNTVTDSFLRVSYNKYKWLAFRNPINYFEYKYLGFQFQGDEKYTITGSLDVGDSTNDEPGLKIIELSNGKYEYYYIKKWSDTTCLRFRMGWKIGDLQNKRGSWCQSVLVLSPYKKYSGR